MAQELGNMSLHGAFDLSALVNKKTARDQAGATQPTSNQEAALVRDITEADMAEVVTLSQTVPVILEFYGQGQPAVLGPIIESFGGRLALATIDVAKAPELVQGLGITGIPTVVAIIQGRPAPLFQGIPPEDDLRRLFAEVLQVARQAGVTGTIDTGNAEEPAEETPAQPEWLTGANEALARNDFDQAAAFFDDGIARNPRMPEAVTGRARVEPLRRIHQSGKSEDVIRREAADNPHSLPHQFLVADLDLSGGHLEDSFRRLLTLFEKATGDDREAIKNHLIELFDAGGVAHPAVIAARQKLSSLLY
jgi:putative thioredoxin